MPDTAGVDHGYDHRSDRQTRRHPLDDHQSGRPSGRPVNRNTNQPRPIRRAQRPSLPQPSSRNARRVRAPNRRPRPKTRRQGFVRRDSVRPRQYRSQPRRLHRKPAIAAKQAQAMLRRRRHRRHRHRFDRFSTAAAPAHDHAAAATTERSRPHRQTDASVQAATARSAAGRFHDRQFDQHGIPDRDRRDPHRAAERGRGRNRSIRSRTARAASRSGSIPPISAASMSASTSIAAAR